MVQRKMKLLVVDVEGTKVESQDNKVDKDG